MAVWKVSYVVENSSQASGIINLNHPSEPGEVLDIGHHPLQVHNVFELIPQAGVS